VGVGRHIRQPGLASGCSERAGLDQIAGVVGLGPRAPNIPALYIYSLYIWSLVLPIIRGRPSLMVPSGSAVRAAIKTPPGRQGLVFSGGSGERITMPKRGGGGELGFSKNKH
jgi:hypothetical protein